MSTVGGSCSVVCVLVLQDNVIKIGPGLPALLHQLGELSNFMVVYMWLSLIC